MDYNDQDYSDPLAPARGVIIGLLCAAPVWIAFLAWLAVHFGLWEKLFGF